LLGIAGDFSQPGALRSAAERIVAQSPDAFCLHGVAAGDAYAIATRFDCEWAYRGAQALFWRGTFHIHEVHDRYLPAPPMRPFERRGFLEVNGEFAGLPVSLIATQLSPDRFRIREMRFVRTAVRAASSAVVLFVAGFDANSQTYGFDDLAPARLVIA